MHHIADVLANVERQATSPEERRALRLIALIHDTFKYRVDQSRPKTGPNHHAAIARAFAERYIDDPALLDIIELHDEAYNSWLAGARNGRWPRWRKSRFASLCSAPMRRPIRWGRLVESRGLRVEGQSGSLASRLRVFDRCLHALEPRL